MQLARSIPSEQYKCMTICNVYYMDFKYANCLKWNGIIYMLWWGKKRPHKSRYAPLQLSSFPRNFLGIRRKCVLSLRLLPVLETVFLLPIDFNVHWRCVRFGLVHTAHFLQILLYRFECLQNASFFQKISQQLLKPPNYHRWINTLFGKSTKCARKHIQKQTQNNTQACIKCALENRLKCCRNSV